MDDLAVCAALMEEGRDFQRSQGFVQWTRDYPNADTVLEDVRTGKGYVLRVDGRVAGYLCLDFDGEPAYEDIRGRWETQPPYAALHRVSIGGGFRGRGLMGRALELCRTLCLDRGVTALRGDTDPQNLPMQRALEKSGFQRRGTVWFQGLEQWAYDLSLV